MRQEAAGLTRVVRARGDVHRPAQAECGDELNRVQCGVVPRVSVIIATYNWSSVLPYSIGSVLRQTWQDFELLVIGDGCTDNSPEVVAAIGDPRVRWINLPQNSGHQSTPNNEGLRQAGGEFIAYLGHDDLWLPHHLAACLEALDRTQADLAYALVACVAAGGTAVWPSVPRPDRGLYSPPSGIVHRRAMTERIGGWRHHRDVHLTPDVELWRRAAASGSPFTLVPRLDAIKFPASWRANVYQHKPSDEQAAWLRRIEREPDLEATELAKAIVADRPNGVSYRRLWSQLAGETWRRLRAPRYRPWKRGGTIEAQRAYKGL